MPTRTPGQGQRKGPARSQGKGKGGNGGTRAPSEGVGQSSASSLSEVEHALISAQRFGPPGINGQQVRLLRSLQRRYGNESVAGVLQLVRESPRAMGEKAEGASGGSPLSLQLQAATACPAPPQAPVTAPPDQDPKFQAVESKIRKQGADAKRHPSAKSKVAEAQAAAVPPANETEAQAQAASAEKMGTARPAAFDKAAFIAAVNKAIADASPKTLEDADQFASSGKAGAIKNQVMDKVTLGKEDSAKDVKEKTSEPPDPSKATPKPVTPMAEEKPGSPPQDPGAAKAMPDPAPPEQTNLAAGKCETESKMAEAGVTDEHLKRSNEPQFQEAVEAKKAGEEHSAKAPGEVKAQEAGQLRSSQQGASASTKSAVDTMHGKKASALGQVSGDKGATKARDEAARAKVSADIEAMYTRTKAEVDGILNGLDAKVTDAFNKGEAEARKAFDENLRNEMQRWKDQRYSGISGAAQWLIDKVAGPPPEANEIYRRARDLYLARMNQTISNVADVVGTELTNAKNRIAQGRDEIKKYVAGLGPELKRFGAEAEKAVASKFDDLEKDVDAKQESVVSDLAQKYVEARNKVDEDIKKMQEENKGLWDRAKEAVGGAVEAILKLKDLFMSVLAKAANAFTKILSDPVAFISNFMGAVKQGFMNFAGNILGHLKKGLMGWLFGALAEAGLELPETFDFMGILKMIASILGLTWGAIKAQIIRLAPWIARAIDFIESKVEVFVILATKGVAGLWNWIKDKLGDLKEMILTPIKDFVVEKIVKSGITWVLGLLNPAGALIKIVQALISVVQWVMERGAALGEFVGTVVDSVSDIAFGGIGGVPAKIEGALGKAVPLVISFLASLLGLGGIGEKIKEIFETVKKPVTAAIHAVVNGAIKVAKKLWGSIKSLFGKKGNGREEKGEGKDSLSVEKDVKRALLGRLTQTFEDPGQVQAVLGGIFNEYRPKGLKSIRLRQTAPDAFDTEIEASPATNGPTLKFRKRDFEARIQEEVNKAGEVIERRRGISHVALVGTWNSIPIKRFQSTRKPKDSPDAPCTDHHAEARMVDYLRTFGPQHPPKEGSGNRLEVMITKSPCLECGNRLRDLATGGVEVVLSITGLHSPGGEAGRQQSIATLQRLKRAGVELRAPTFAEVMAAYGGEELDETSKRLLKDRLKDMQEVIGDVNRAAASVASTKVGV